jgi:outer membrane receptor for ferrienterochelin and colicin
MFRALSFLIAAACTHILVYAGTTGILEGTIRDKRTGEPLPGVNVFLPQVKAGTSTDADGLFTIQNLRAGAYDVRFTIVGYGTKLLRDVIINPDLRTRVKITLEATDVEMEEVVVIQGKPPIQTDVTGTAFMIGPEDLQILPISTPLDAMRFKPGVTLDGNVRGGRTTEVAYLVDGLPVQDLMQGGVTSTLPLSSVVGMSLYTGGYEAEYGNALSGVVNLVTRQGGDTHHLFVRANSDRLGTGDQQSKLFEGEVSANGPVIPERLFYVAAASSYLSDTRWWQDFQFFFPSPIEKTFNAFGKLDYVVSPIFRLGAQVLYTDHSWRDYEFSWRYNLNGLPPEDRSSDRIMASFSHTVSDKFFYTASLSRYHVHASIGGGGKDQVPVDNPYQYDFFLRYIVSGARALWMENTQDNYTLKIDGTMNPWSEHLVKMGVEFNLYDLHSDIVKYEPRKTYFGKPLVNEPQLDFSSSYEYQPRSGSVYVQDKIDLLKEGLLLNVGLRYDFLNPRASRPAIEGTIVGDTAYVQAVGPALPASAKGQLSPRIGLAMPVIENGYAFFNLGWYFQYPLFDYLYTGLDRVALAKGVGAVTGNPDLEPERSLSWEFSFKYAFPLDLVASFAYFKKESTNLTDTKTFVPGDSKVAGDFGFAEFVNNPYAVASGIELVLTRNKGGWVTGELSYTYMRAEGQAGSPYDGFYIAQYGLPPAKRTYPLSWDQRHTIKGVVGLHLPLQFEVLAAGEWNSGRPYTSYPTSTGFEPVDGGPFVQNNDRMPEYFVMDLKVEKHFQLSPTAGSRLTLLLDVRNLTNAQNVAWIDSNGRIGGELGDPSGYYIGRRTRLGVQLTL